MSLQIVLCATDRALGDAWARFCDDLDDVTIHQGSILDVEADAWVSPANSFGFMDGGIDAVYLDHLGRDLQTRVQQVIIDRHDGELLVGEAELVATGRQDPSWLVVAPTMRVPMVLSDSINPFLAMRAVLRAVVRHNASSEGSARARVSCVAVPGLGTGVGAVPPAVCAHQVRRAIEEHRSPAPFPRTWAEASERHQLLYTDRPRRLQA